MSAIDGEIDDEIETLYLIAEKFEMDKSSISSLVEWYKELEVDEKGLNVGIESKSPRLPEAIFFN